MPELKRYAIETVLRKLKIQLVIRDYQTNRGYGNTLNLCPLLYLVLEVCPCMTKLGIQIIVYGQKKHYICIHH